jgi:hypothetical protein
MALCLVFPAVGWSKTKPKKESSPPAKCAQKLPATPAKKAPPAKSTAKRIFFQRYVDRTEGAFLLLIPKGWSTVGGIVRVNPLTAVGGVAQAIEAKIDFTVQADPTGQVMVRYLPKINYAEPSPYNAMLGGNWNGMPIVACPSAQQFLKTMLLPSLRPRASEVKVIDYTPRPDVVAAVRAMPVAQAILGQGGQYNVDAGMLTVTYREGGIIFKEFLFSAIERFGYMGANLWSNTFSVAARAPEAEASRYSPIAKVIINSFVLNPTWLAAEQKGQQARAQIVTDTMKDLARIDREIAENRAKTMADINEQQYLTLTDQEKYINPHTGQVEFGSNQWKNRWENAGGEVIYADDSNWDPNLDPELKLSGFKRSEAARR